MSRNALGACGAFCLSTCGISPQFAPHSQKIGPFFNALRGRGVGSISAHLGAMNKKIPAPLLMKLARDAQAGRPLWSLLWANEYLEAKDPLRLALASRTQTFFKNVREKSQLTTAEKICAGARLSSLSSDEKASARELLSSEGTAERRVVVPSRFRFSESRRATASRRQARAPV